MSDLKASFDRRTILAGAAGGMAGKAIPSIATRISCCLKNDRTPAQNSDEAQASCSWLSAVAPIIPASLRPADQRGMRGSGNFARNTSTAKSNNAEPL